MPSPTVSRAIKDVAIVAAGVLIIWLGLRVAFATDNPFYVVSSGSMVPELHIHDVLIVKDGSTFKDVQVGDIIVFNRPSGQDRVIVHRVVEIKESSERILTTKGDANPASIPGTDYPITDEEYIGKVVYVIPQIGYVTRLINPPINYIIIAVILALLFFNRAGRKKKDGTGKDDAPPPSDSGAGDQPSPPATDSGAGDQPSPPSDSRRDDHSPPPTPPPGGTASP